ncbi:transposase [Paraburkholderia sediminicola]|uniref:transposase n=2 Tax=Paraburkholderia TaxID=1822464 RepID=UPI0038B85242
MLVEPGLSRSEHPRQFMAWLCVMLSEHSSGNKRRQGSNTRHGNRRRERRSSERPKVIDIPPVSASIRRRYAGLSRPIIGSRERCPTAFEFSRANGLHGPLR